MKRPGCWLRALFLSWIVLTALAPPAAAQEGSTMTTLAKTGAGEIPNPNPLLSPHLVPGFQLEGSVLTKGDNGPWWDILRERWLKEPPAGVSGLGFIDITLRPKQNRMQAMKCASDCYGADTDANQKPELGVPFPGSFSGQPIGDFCWAYVYSLLRPEGAPRPALNKTASLVVVSDRYCLKIQLSGPGDTGQGFEDAFVESLAKSIVERLKTWQPPG